MNCDEFLEALTSSDERRQTAARWHAQSCPACAALAEVDALLKRELAAPEPEPLSNRLRVAWESASRVCPGEERAADTPGWTTQSGGSSLGGSIHSSRVSHAPSLTHPTSSFRHLPIQLVSLAAALLLLLSVTLLIWQPAKIKDTAELPGINTSPNSAVTVKTIDASADLADLLAQVTSLEAELNKTSQQAELVDVRREADVLLATFNHW